VIPATHFGRLSAANRMVRRGALGAAARENPPRGAPAMLTPIMPMDDKAFTKLIE